MIASGLIGAFTEWLSAIGRYQVNPFNTLGFIHVFGLQNLLATIGFNVPSLLPVGVAAIIGLWRSRFRVADSDILSLLIGLTLVFGFSHDYDVSAFAVALPAFWRHLRGKLSKRLSPRC